MSSGKGHCTVGVVIDLYTEPCVDFMIRVSINLKFYSQCSSYVVWYKWELSPPPKKKHGSLKNNMIFRVSVQQNWAAMHYSQTSEEITVNLSKNKKKKQVEPLGLVFSHTSLNDALLPPPLVLLSAVFEKSSHLPALLGRNWSIQLNILSRTQNSTSKPVWPRQRYSVLKAENFY